MHFELWRNRYPFLSVNPDSIKFGSCSFESDKFITVCETGADGATQVAMIDLSAGNSCLRQRMSAEAAIMNPVFKGIALRGA
jgi:clathrin heavy chain